MHRGKLFIERDNTDGWIKLREEGGAEAWVEPRRGFALNDLRAALLATPLVAECGGELFLQGAADCRTVAELVDAMQEYFLAPGKPGERLCQVQSAVESMLDTAPLRVTPWAFAWLDLAVREDLADEARGNEEIWSSGEIVLRAAEIRRRRVDELAHRFALAHGEPRMAASQRTRGASAPDHTKSA